MDYFKKIDNKLNNDLVWNVPEQKQGKVNVIGGNSQSFKTEIKISEFLLNKYPIETLNAVLPDALKNELPPFPNFKFLKSTDSGSFADEKEMTEIFNSGDFNLLLGDLSKNSITGKIVLGACENTEKPLLITRDAIDLLLENLAEKSLINGNLIFFGSMVQIQKLLKAVFYPRMLLLSQSLIQVAETLHKFTLSYPVAIITLHNNQILIVKDGSVKDVPIEKSGWTPMTIWQGELAAKILALNLYNPNNFTNATISALFS